MQLAFEGHRGRTPMEIRTGESPLPRSSPLPWLLLGLTVLVAVGIFGMARARLGDEKLRTANALKANDEVMTKLRLTTVELQGLKDQAAKDAAARTELETKLATVTAEKQACEAVHAPGPNRQPVVPVVRKKKP